jgi:hypothetical protein
MFEKRIGLKPIKCLWIDFRGFFYGIKLEVQGEEWIPVTGFSNLSIF